MKPKIAIKPQDTERRFTIAGIELRARADKPAELRGYAALFNTLSQDLGGFVERIAPGAFDDVLGDDVRATFNHDANVVLGRTTADTLRIAVDDKGLRYEVDLPDTSIARDLTVSIQRGDVNQSSFMFRVAAGGDTWEEMTPTDGESLIVRTITKFERLYDVSPVTYPAYIDASVGVRGLQHWKEQQEDGQRVKDKERRALQASARNRYLRLRMHG